MNLDTRDLEREILLICLSSKVRLRKYFNQVEEEWFQGRQRLFIYEIIKEKYEDSQSCLSDKIFEFELRNRIPEEEHDIYISEWNLVKKCNDSSAPETIIDALNKKALERETTDVLEEVMIHMEKGDIEEAVNALKSKSLPLGLQKSVTPIHSYTDTDFREKMMKDRHENPEKYAGLKTGFQTFDRQTGGVFKKEYTLFAAMTGVGKSTMMKAFEAGLMMNNEGINVLHITNEEDDIQVLQKFDAITSGIPFFQFKRATLMDGSNKGLYDHWKRTIDTMKTNDKVGNLFVKEVEAYSTIIEIEKAYYELEQQGIIIDVIAVDYLNHLMPMQKCHDINDERIKASTDLKTIAKNLNVAVVSAAQASTTLTQSQKRDSQTNRLDIYGAKGQLFPVNSFYVISQERQATEKWINSLPWEDYVSNYDDNGNLINEPRIYNAREDYELDWFWKIWCRKNRDGSEFSFDARYRVRIGRVEEVGQTDDPVGDTYKFEELLNLAPPPSSLAEGADDEIITKKPNESDNLLENDSIDKEKTEAEHLDLEAKELLNEVIQNTDEEPLEKEEKSSEKFAPWKKRYS